MCLRAQEASIAGVIVNVITGEPLSGVHVTIYGAHVTPDGVTDLAYGALSGQDGRFSIGGVAPGSYRLVPQLRGFVYARTKTEGAVLRDLALRPGQQLADFRLPMMPSAVVAGRVVNEDGDPVQHVDVMPVTDELRPPSAFGWRLFSSVSDDHGGFRIAVPPGKYYLSATPETPSLAGSEKSELRTGRNIAR